ncbi:neuroblast differentiation-associated protein AHNAK-like [Oncorhynchus clarkii lewisi]|uniref:neuroblast differentiation-associated protein AHNAK-like n=1 Tax=Oncorhynchus clarkii lewisi TaxID=490388 RepID=UPI0039B99F34
MCDCLHLAFPNWHGSPGTGAGRRLKGPEPDTVDDSICEEPSEFIEGERPRPQGSSPVDEYPETDEYTDIDKQGGGGSGKKGKRGFGSLFEKRSPAKMSELESSESGVIVRMAKETCAEGLVVSGGGKEGIFIKEVRPESPASKLLSVHEGDQILSATVYFDDVKYEDALQILEHAQPYKMELLLKRKPLKISTLESEPALESQVEQGSSLEMRGHSKTKRHGDRISWPNFPSFSKSRKSHFKRSHSTADADDQRKLELSPTTSDTESPIKSQEAVKGRTKKQKIKLSSLKMKGRKSRSVEQSGQDTDILTVECAQVMEIQQSQDDIYSPDGLESTSGETPQVYVFESESEKMEPTKIKNECSLPDLTGSENKQHKVELIRLDKTLKTTDITVAFADQESPLTKTSLEEKKKKKEKKERSELKFRIKGKETKDKHKHEKHVKSSPKSMKIPRADIITSDLSAHDNTLLIPTIVSHTKLMERQLPIDMSDVGLIRKSPQIGQERDLKETHVKTNLNAQEMPAKVTSITMEPDLQMEIQALKLPTETSIDDVLVHIGTRTATKFKLPREDLADFVTAEPIQMTDVRIVEMDVKSLKVEDRGLKILPNRDDIEIPGMEDASSTGTKTPVIKQPKTAFTLPVEEIQAVQMVIDVGRVKEAVSKLPGFKLPKGDTVGLPAHQEITKTDVNAERVNVTVETTRSKITDIKAQLDTYVKKTDINASPEKLSRSSVTTIKLPKNQLSDLGAHEPITMTEIYHTKRKEEAGRTNEVEIQIELHKRENVEIPGMENIHQKGSPNQVEREKELAVPVPEWPTIKAEETNVIPYTKGLDKKSKKSKMSMPAPNVAVDVPDVEKDIKVQGTEIPEPKLTLSEINIEKPRVDIKGPNKDLDVNLKKLEMFTSTELKVQVQPPSVELKVPSGEVEIPEGAAKEIDVKIKKPRMSFGWFSKPEVKVPEVDISLTNVDISLPEGKVEVKEPDVEMKSPDVQIEMKHDIELEGQGSQFKLPPFGLSISRVKGPEIGLSLSKADVDVDLPEGRADLQLPDVEVGVPSVEVEIPEAGSKDIDVKMRKSRMSFPKIGFSKPEVKAPEVDISLPEVDISLPEGKVEVKEPELEIKTPEIQVDVKDTVGSPSRFKMPTLKFPTFGAVSPNVTLEVSDLDKDIKVHGTEIPEPKLTISAFNIEKPSVDLKGPSIDVNHKKNENVILPEVKMNVQPPSIELKVPSGEVEMPEGAATEMDVKMKKPRMSFGWFSKPEAKAPEVDISLTNVDISLPEGKVEVKEPDVEMKSPDVQIEMKHDIELEDQGSQFKLPKFGLSLPRVKGPEIGLSLSKTDVEVDLPEGRADLQLPDVEVRVPSVEVEIPEAGSKDIDVKMRKPRMSFPKFGFSKPEVKAPEVDISLPEVDISLPGGKLEVKEPEVEMKTPEIQVDVKDTVGSPSRFKMPTLKFPKFGAASPNVTIEVPDLDKNIKVHGTEIPEPKLTISAFNIEKPSVDLKGPSIDVDRKKNENVTLPEVKMNVQPPSIELKVPSGEVEMPEGAATEMDVKMKKPRMSFGWFSKPEAKAPEVDISHTNVDISLPEGKVEVKEPDVEMKSPGVQIEMKHDIELEGQGSQFKLPKFGLSLPRVKGPEIGLSLSKTDVDVDLPEGRADLQLPDVEVGVPSVEVEIPEAGSKDIVVKMRKPRMSFPKFGFSKPEVKAPEVDISLPEVDISLPEGKLEVKEPEVEMKTPEIQVDVKDTVGSPSRFKMPTLKFPKFGAASPNVTIEVPDLDKNIKVHGTEIPEPKLTISAFNIEKPSVDLKGPSIDVDRKKNENVTLPEVKMKVQPPSIELKVPSGEVEMPEGAATEMDVKMKKPRMSFGWFSKPEAKAPEVDISLTNVDFSLPEGKVEVKEPDVEMKSPGVQIEMKHDIELEGQGSPFKLPKFGLSLPRVKGPEIGLSLSKTDVDVDLPEGRADLQLPDVEVGVPSVEVEIPEAGSKDIDVKMRKPRMSFPKFGFSKPEVKAPEVDISLPEVDISLPEGKLEVKEPEVEMKTPEIQVDVKDTVGSPSRFKMPTLKFPKFGAASPNVTIEVPDLDKNIKVHGTEIPEPKLTISAFNIEKPSVDLKGPSIDVDRKKNENVTLPEVKMKVQPPSIELKVPSGEVEMPEGAATEMDVKMKKPRMSFGWFSKPEAKAPEVDISLTNVDISLPEGKVEVKEPDVEMKSPGVQIEMKHDIELEGQGSQFKLPKFGLSLPRVKGPEIGLSLSKTDVDVDLPEGRADLQLPDVEVGVPSVEVEIPEAGSKDIDVKMRKPRMSFPKFGFSKPEVKAPEVDISLPEVDISLPEGKLEVKEPEVEMKTPEIQVDVKDTVGSPSRFKMPTLKFPKFGAASPNVTIEVPDLDKNIKVHGTEIPEPKLTISAFNIEKPSVDLKGPSIDVDRKKNENVTLPEVKMKVQPPSIELKVPSGEVEMPEGAATEMDVKMKKPRMSFGWFSKPEAKAPEVDISHTNVDISLPEGKVEVKEPDVEMKSPGVQIEMKHDIELEGQGSQFKLPKFGLSLPRVKGPEIGLSLSKTDVDVDLPEGRADLQLPDVEVGVPSVEVEIPEAGSKDIDVKMRKPRMSFPKFGFSKPEVKAPEVDISLPEVDISLPEGKLEVKEPEVEMKTPEIQVDVKDTVGSPSRFKMPTLKFPKFGAASPNVTIEVPDLDNNIKVHGTEIPEPKLTISAFNIEKPSVDLKGPSIDVNRKKNENVTLPEVKMKVQPPSIELKVPSGEVEMPEGAATEMDVKMKKPRMSFGWFSKPEAKAPEVDISLTNVDISLPEGKVEVKEPDVEMKSPDVQIEMKHDIELEGQGSPFKLPKFGLSLPRVKGPEIGLSLSKTDVDVDLPEGRADLQLPDVEVGVPSVEVEIPEAGSKDIDVKMRKPRMSFPKFGFSKPEVKAPEVDISLPEVDISLPEGKLEVKEPEVEMKTPEIQVDVKDTVGSPSRFKMPTLKFPKFGAASPNVTIEVPDLDKNIKVHGTEIPEPKLTISAFNIEKPSVDLKGPSIDVDRKKNENVTLPEVKMKVQPPSIELKVPSGEVEMPEGAATEMDVKMKKPRMSFGWFSKPEAKAPEVDISLTNVDFSLPEGKVEVKEPDVEMKSPGVQIEMKHDIELEGQGSQFKLPKFGLSLPRVKGPEIGLSLSKTDVDVDLPEGRADLQLPDVEVGVPSVEVEIPEAGSKDIDVKMRKPRMSFPKFGFSKPEVKAPEVDISLPEVDISLPEGKLEVKEPEVEMKTPEIQVDVKDTVGSPSRFKMPTLKFPKFGAASPNVTIEVPDLDKNIKVHGTEIPEPKLTISAFNIEKPSVDLKGPSIDVDRKKNENVTLPEVKMKVQPPSIELKVPSGEVEMPEGAATEIDVKMKKPRMSFGWFSKPEAKAPEVDISLTNVDISLPEGKVEVKEPDVEMKSPDVQIEMKHDIELEGQGSPFKLPKFGLSLPRVKGPEIGLSLSKTDVEVDLPEGRADLQLPDVEVGVPSVEVEIPEAGSKDIDVKMRKPRMSFPKFGFSKPEVKAPEVDISLPEVDISLPGGKLEVKEPEVEMKTAEIQVDVKDTIGSPSRFKMPTLKFPKFGAASPNVTIEVPDLDKNIKVHGTEIPEPKLTISAFNIEKPSVDLKGQSIDVNRKKNENVTLPEVKMKVQPPRIELKVPSGEVEMPEGAATEMDVKMKKPRMSFGWFSKPEAKAPEVDISLTNVDISLPEGKLEVKEPEVEMKTPEIQVDVKDTVGSPSRFKMPTLKFPKFGAASPNVTIEVPDLDKDIKVHGTEIPDPKLTKLAFNIEKPSVDLKGPSIDLNRKRNDNVTLPKVLMNVQPPSIELKVPSGEVEMPEGAATEMDVKMKKPRKSFGWFSKPDVKALEVDVSLTKVDLSLPEGKVVKESYVEMKAPESQVELKSKGFSVDGKLQTQNIEDKIIEMGVKKPLITFPKIVFSRSEITAPEIVMIPPNVDISLPEGKVFKVPEVKIEAPEIEVDVKEAVGSPSRFKMPTFKLPTFGSTSKVAVVVSDKEKVIEVPGVEILDQVLGASFPVDLTEPVDTVDIKGCSEVHLYVAGSEGPSVEEGMTIADVDVHGVDSSELTIDDKGHGLPSKGQGSPSKFKLPTFKMPKLSISKSKPQNEHEHDDISPNIILENNEIHVEPQGPAISPKLTLTTFGEVLRSIDVEFYVPALEEVEEKLTGSREGLSAETQSIQEEEEAKEKSKFVWFKFPTFGLSSPSESAKILEKDTSEKEASENSPAGDSVEQDSSLTFSVRSSDAFADISSTVTSEQVAPSLASPTKVTVKYSDPIATEIQGNITSTARTKIISFEPYLAEKVTIPMSSGASSSSVDTLKLASGTHVITSNIQAIPDTQKATLLTDFGLQTGTAGASSASWSVDDTNKTQSDGQTVIKRHVIREMSGTDKETVVITRRVTHVFGAEPISDETASSIKQMKETMHSEKMKFFDGAQLE